MGRTLPEGQECSQRCHTGRDGKGSLSWEHERRWQTWSGETWSGCQSKHRYSGLKGLHMAPNHTWSNSSLCFQVIASTSVAMLELEKQQKFLQRSPRPLWGLNIFPVWKSSLGELLIWISQCRCQEPGATEEEHLLTAWILPVLHTTSLSTCLTLHRQKITASLFTVPLSVLHAAFASCLTSTADQAKQQIPDPWVQTPKPCWQLLAQSKTNPFFLPSMRHWPKIMVGRDTEAVKHFYLWSQYQYSNSLQAINPLE